MVDMLDKSQSVHKHYNGFIALIWTDIATNLKGTEGSSKIKTGDMCHSHWNVLSRRYKDVRQLVDENGASWNNETSMIELSGERWSQIVNIPTSANKRLGWFRGKSFPLYMAVGAVVNAGPPVHIPFAPGDRLARFLLEHPLQRSDEELRQAKLESDSLHSLSTSSMADSSIPSKTSTNKRKFCEDQLASNEDDQKRSNSSASNGDDQERSKSSASNEDDRERSNSSASTVRSSTSPRNKARKSTTEISIDLMNSIQDKFINQMKAEHTVSSPGIVVRPLDSIVSAVRVIRKMKDLETGFLFKALDLFKDQPQSAKIFAILESEELRMKWLKYQFEKL